MADAFKQKCPGCEEMVTISDPSKVGKKIECPECKHKFQVEAPAKSNADKSKEKKGNTKVDGKAAAVKAKKELEQAESKGKAKKGSGKKLNPMVLIGIGVAVLAVVGIAAALFLMGGGQSSTDKDSRFGKGSPNKGKGPGKSNDDNPPPPMGEENKGEGKDWEKKGPPPSMAKADGVDPDVSNRLPNDSKYVCVYNMKPFFDSSFAKALLNTPGSFNRDEFKRSFGVGLEEMEQIILASNDLGLPIPNLPGLAKKKWKMAVLRSDRAFSEKQLDSTLNLTQESPIEGLVWHKIGKNLDSLSNLLCGFEPGDQISLFLADSRTVVLATPEKMDDFLRKDKGKPKKISAPPPPPAPPMDDPNNPAGPGSPPMPVGATGAGGPPPIAGGPPGPGGKPMGPGGPPGAPPTEEGGAAPPSPAQPAKGNLYQTLPQNLARCMLVTNWSSVPMAHNLGVPGDGGCVLSVGIDATEFKAIIQMASLLLSTQKLPNGAPYPQEIISQISAFSKIDTLFAMVPKFNLEEQSLIILAQSKDQKIGQSFAKIVNPFFPRLPRLFTEFKLDVASSFSNELPEDGTPGTPGFPGGPGGPGGLGGPGISFGPGGPGGPGGDGSPMPKGNHGKVAGGVTYVPQVGTIMGLGTTLHLPSELLKSVEGQMAEEYIKLKNTMTVKILNDSAESLAKALTTYVSNNKAFPFGTAKEGSQVTKFGLRVSPDKRVGWMAELLQSIGAGEYAAFSSKLDRTKPWMDGQNANVARIVVPEFLIQTPKGSLSPPSDSHAPGLTNFVGIAGIGFDAAEYKDANAATDKKKGIFGYERQTKVADIKDGVANTIALMVLPLDRAQPWLAGGGATITGVSEGPNALEPFMVFEEVKDKSRYGVAIMADGKIRKIPAKLPVETFRAMCTINGGEAINQIDRATPVIKIDIPVAQR